MYKGKHLRPRRRRSPLVLPAVIAALLLLLAVASGWSGSSAGTSSAAVSNAATTPMEPPTAAPSTQVSVATGLKPMPVGLYTLGHSAGSGVHGVFLNVPWSSLEPADQSFVGPGWSNITSALDDPGVTGVKLRVFAGMYAPDWLKSDVGSVRLDTRCCGSITVPEYWTPEFQLQYQQLMVELAGRYDSNPRLLSVTDSACMTATAEPFIKGGPRAGAELYAAGDDQANELYCFQTSMAAQMAAFSTTRTDLAGHLAWQIPAPTGVQSSWADERDLVVTFLAEYGDKLIFQDNGLATQRCKAPAPDPTTASDLWCFMKAIGGKTTAVTSIGFQRGCGEKVSVCSTADVIRHAIALGACWLEHAGYPDLTSRQISRFTARLRSDPGCAA